MVVTKSGDVQMDGVLTDEALQAVIAKIPQQAQRQYGTDEQLRLLIPWREIMWINERNREVSRMVFHVDELAEVLALPFPEGATAHEPVYEFSAFNGGTKFFRRCLVKTGDTFSEFINQGERDCLVLAVDPDTGRYLYEYVMPAGSSALRW